MKIFSPRSYKEDILMEEDDNCNSSLERGHSSGSESLDALAENVKALYVKETVPTRPQAKELIHKLIQDFTEYDTTFLKEYLNVLQNSSHSAVKDITNNIVFSIEGILKQHLKSNRQWQEPVVVVLLGWMCVTILCLVDPLVQSPYRALSELLLFTSNKERIRLASLFWRNLSPAQLIELADVTTGPKPEPKDSTETEVQLSDLLLRAAFCRLQSQQHDPQWQLGSLKVEEVATGLTSAWVDANADDRSLLAKVAARTQAVRSLVNIAEAAHAAGQPETLRVLVEMSKLRLLFLDNDKINEHITKKSRKRRQKNE